MRRVAHTQSFDSTFDNISRRGAMGAGAEKKAAEVRGKRKVGGMAGVKKEGGVAGGEGGGGIAGALGARQVKPRVK